MKDHQRGEGKERQDQLFMMGTGSESLANKKGKLEETLKITSGSMGLFRNDGDKIAQLSAEDAMRERWKRKGGKKTVNCIAVFLENYFPTDIIYKQQKITRR